MIDVDQIGVVSKLCEGGVHHTGGIKLCVELFEANGVSIPREDVVRCLQRELWHKIYGDVNNHVRAAHHAADQLLCAVSLTDGLNHEQLDKFKTALAALADAVTFPGRREFNVGLAL